MTAICLIFSLSESCKTWIIANCIHFYISIFELIVFKAFVCSPIEGNKTLNLCIISWTPFTTLFCSVRCLHFVSLNNKNFPRSSALHISSLAIFPTTLWSRTYFKQVDTNRTAGSSINSVAGMFKILLQQGTHATFRGVFSWHL